MKYRLTEYWLEYKKGHVFECREFYSPHEGNLVILKTGDKEPRTVSDVDFSLLLKTGILEEVKEGCGGACGAWSVSSITPVKEEEWPYMNSPYWIVQADGSIARVQWTNHVTDKRNKEVGNCFQKSSQAQEASEQIKTLLLSLKK